MAIVRRDKMLSGYNGNLESVIVHNNAGVPVQTTNGVFVVLEGLMADERELKKARLAGVDDVGEEVLLIDNPEVMYDEGLYKLEDYVIKAGEAARAYRLNDGDIITLTEDLFAEEVAVGDKLVVKANGKLGKDETALPEARYVFNVIEDSGNELHRSMGAYALQITRQK